MCEYAHTFSIFSTCECAGAHILYTLTHKKKTAKGEIAAATATTTGKKPYLCVYFYIHMYKFSSHQLLLMYTKGRKKRLYDRNDVVIDNVKRNGISPFIPV